MVNPNQKISGFTFIEFLAVIAIIGILTAIALPSFLNPGCCLNCGSEAKAYVGTLSRAQQVRLLEKKRFASSISELGSDFSSETKYYTYSVASYENKAFVFGNAKNPYMKSYVSGVFATPTEKNASVLIICVVKKAGTQSIWPPIDAQTCGEGTVNTYQIR
jgi:type IV pilus assembly protein PilA